MLAQTMHLELGVVFSLWSVVVLKALAHIETGGEQNLELSMAD